MSKRKTSEDYPIKKEYYYIIDFRDYHKLKIYHVYFVNPKTAQRAINNTIKSLKERKLFYGVIRGNKISQLTIPYTFSRSFRSTRYDYPEEKVTYQQRKTYRTVRRRRLRRMGLLTLINPKRKVREPITQIRLIKNTQEVANSPNTIARVIRLERKPSRYYYFIIKKLPIKIKGVLVKVKCIRLDSKKGTIKRMKLNILRNDIIIPHILSEIPPVIKHLPNHEKISRRLKKIGFTILT